MDQIRPFCKILNVATNASSQIGLFDSKGNPLFSDSIEIVPALGSSGTGYYWVQPSGLRNSTVSLHMDPSSTLASGAIGGVGTPSIPLLLELGPGGDACSAVQIVNRLTNSLSPMTFLITYGVRRQSNLIRSMSVSAGL